VWELSWSQTTHLDTITVSPGDTLHLHLSYCRQHTDYPIYLCHYAGEIALNTLEFLTYTSTPRGSEVDFPTAAQPTLLSVRVSECDPHYDSYQLGVYTLRVSPTTPPGLRAVFNPTLGATQITCHSEGLCPDTCFCGEFAMTSVFYRVRSVATAAGSWSALKSRFDSRQ
jgi:hypothetical protein